MLSHSGVDVTPEPGLFLSRDYDGDGWESPSCTQAQARGASASTVLSMSSALCSTTQRRSVLVTNLGRYSGTEDESLGPQQETK